MTKSAAKQGASRARAMTWIGVILSLVAVGVLLSRVSFRDLANALATANVPWLVAAVLVFVGMFVLRAWRWSILLGGTPFGATWHANIIGYMFNITLPLRLGEIARVYVIAQGGEVSIPRGLSGALVERLIDLATVVLLFAAFTLRVPMRGPFTAAAITGSVAVTVCVVGAALVVAKGDAVERLLRARLAGRTSAENIDRWLGRFRDIREGFRAIGSGKRLLQCFLLTASIWAATIGMTAISLEAFLPGQSDLLTRAGLVVVAANLGGALPSAPGGLGIVQGFATSALVIPFGVPESAALAFVLVWSLGPQLLLVVLGLISLGRVGVSFSEIRQRAEQRPTPSQLTKA